MSRCAPFTKSEESNKTCGALPCAIAFLLLAFVPIIVYGPILGQWCLSLWWSVIAACAVLFVCGASLLSVRFVRNFPFTAEPIARLGALTVGTVLLMFPVALYAGMHPGALENVERGNWLITISSTIYSAVKTVALDMTPSDWIDNTRALGALDGCLLSTHAFLLLVFAVACPLAAVFAAFDAFVNGVSGTRIRFWSWRKSRSSTSPEIYVFHELDEYGATLARSIIKARKKQLPLVIFANVGDLDASRDETLMEDLVDYARGKAYVLYTSLPAESVPHKLSKRALKKCYIRYFAISENSSANLQTAVMLWDVVFEQLWDETWKIWQKKCAWRHCGLKADGLCKAIASAMKSRMNGDSSTPAKASAPCVDPAWFDPMLCS